MPSLLNTKWTISGNFDSIWAHFDANNQATITFVPEPKFQNPATWQEGKRCVTFSLQFNAVTDGSYWSLQGTHTGGKGSGSALVDAPGAAPATYPFTMVKQ